MKNWLYYENGITLLTIGMMLIVSSLILAQVTNIYEFNYGMPLGMSIMLIGILIYQFGDGFKTKEQKDVMLEKYKVVHNVGFVPGIIVLMASVVFFCMTTYHYTDLGLLGAIPPFLVGIAIFAIGLLLIHTDV